MYSILHDIHGVAIYICIICTLYYIPNIIIYHNILFAIARGSLIKTDVLARYGSPPRIDREKHAHDEG